MDLHLRARIGLKWCIGSPSQGQSQLHAEKEVRFRAPLLVNFIHSWTRGSFIYGDIYQLNLSLGSLRLDPLESEWDARHKRCDGFSNMAFDPVKRIKLGDPRGRCRYALSTRFNLSNPRVDKINLQTMLRSIRSKSPSAHLLRCTASLISFNVGMYRI